MGAARLAFLIAYRTQLLLSETIASFTLSINTLLLSLCILLFLFMSLSRVSLYWSVLFWVFFCFFSHSNRDGKRERESL